MNALTLILAIYCCCHYASIIAPAWVRVIAAVALVLTSIVVLLGWNSPLK